MQCWSVKDFHILASKNGEELFRSSLFHYHLFPSTTKRGIMARVGYFGWSHYTPLENLSPLLWGDILAWSCYTGECHHVSLDASFPVDPINALISFRHWKLCRDKHLKLIGLCWDRRAFLLAFSPFKLASHLAMGALYGFNSSLLEFCFGIWGQSPCTLPPLFSISLGDIMKEVVVYPRGELR